ncbi:MULTISPECIES: aspartate-alanine antiporter [Variovorax]|jgi:putative transport protein|uniref:aspartate-alanine antiporter n=1 Tax=Variovorax TaxID=34072 RepID=UPI00086E3831|nr:MULTISPECIES: aspartate-alanine antiporter [Variovorax]MBN8756670.1 aspartate-alanine antiporter [Variovorax sp.]ODU13318.1 MAG: aspartate-alanine antiporter [Variovorax sp. SCN 67-85]ODV18472.1 MAG: aspartate-alanine antiporter [Variovorax sp. SCN 67-20]OJZ11652.1 MAG: aspartate-alanine antiporter [Variovorax sp. 67-131]UKI05684.1 aspartate-alanine antiporter [Variovorax paradoxus]
MVTLTAILQGQPEIALFLVLAIGYAVGQIRFGPIQLGGICGTLIAALVVGQLGIKLDDSVKNVFFMLFIFALGYAGGPQFFANLDAKGLRLGLLCLVEVVAVLALVLTATLFLSLDQGTAAGLMAGAATESAVVGTATDAISKLALPLPDIQQLQANVVTAYSITYVFGLIAIVVATSQIFPLVLRVDLRAEADKLWKTMGGGGDDAESASAVPEMVGRVFLVTVGRGRTVGELTRMFGGHASIERVMRRGQSLAVEPTLRLQAFDQVLAIGRRSVLVNVAELLGREFANTTAFDAVVETTEVVVNRREWFGRELHELGAPLPRGVQIVGLSRDGNAMPLLHDVELQRGDVLKLYGPVLDVSRALPLLGDRVVESTHSNISYAAMGILLGVFIGGFSVKLGGIPFSLGTGGGALLTGLAFGWYQSKNPHRLSVPPEALALMKDLGLATFIACVGLASGPQALALIKKFGIALPLVGVAIAVVPASISLFVGHRLLKLEAPVLLGAIAGQQCSTPALSAVQNAAGNATPLLGYTITYAISNVVLPLMGPLIVALAGLVAHAAK